MQTNGFDTGVPAAHPVAGGSGLMAMGYLQESIALGAQLTLLTLVDVSP